MENERINWKDAHPYKITKAKDGRWLTYVKQHDGKKIVVTKTQLDNMESYLDHFYNDEISNHKYTDKGYAEMEELLDQYKEDFKMYKEVDFFDIRPGAYLVSPKGDIYSCLSEKWIHQFIWDKTDVYPGIKYVRLEGKDGKQHTHAVARIVMAAFNGLPSNDMEDPTVDHIDGNPMNNYYENLRWMERTVNASIRFHRPNGESNGRAILTQNDVITICNDLLKGKLTIKTAAQKYDVSVATIRNIVKHKTWKYLTMFYQFEGVV